MAMLAERRSKKRYNLVPRGKALYEDDSRLGTRLLEKMGWSRGKGLGANEDGNKDFIRIRYKNDSEGLGFEDRSDQWTQHELQFDGLLKTLSNGDDTKDNGYECEENIEMATTVGFGFKQAEEPLKTVKVSGESLEEKSKTSRARVHYQKFTRGKDISRYSEKDLANIFGRKNLVPVTNGHNAGVGGIQSGNNSTNSSQPESDNEEKEFGVVTVSSGTSINDYFKAKMETVRKKLMGGQQVAADDNTAINKADAEANGVLAAYDEEDLLTKCHKKSKKRKHRDDEEAAMAERRDGAGNSENNDGKVKEKSKKSKKATEAYCREQYSNTIAEDDEIKSSKKKSKKDRLEVPTDETVEPQFESKKSKKSKQLNEVPSSVGIPDSPGDEEAPIKKKNKSKRKHEVTEEIPAEEPKKKRANSEQGGSVLSTGEPNLVPLSSKNRKPKFKSTDDSFAEQVVSEEASEQDSKQKKKKKKRLEHTLDNMTEDNEPQDCAAEVSQNVPSERKKKKSRKEKCTEQLEDINYEIVPLEKVKKSKKSKRKDTDECCGNVDSKSTPTPCANSSTTQTQKVHATSISSQSPQSTTTITDNEFRFPELRRRNQKKKPNRSDAAVTNVELEPNPHQTTFVVDTNGATTTETDAEYKIQMNEFVAVKFSNVDFEGFPGSNLPDIPGYSITGGRVKIEIKHRKVDAIQIAKYYESAERRAKDKREFYRKEKMKTTVFPNIVKQK